MPRSTVATAVTSRSELFARWPRIARSARVTEEQPNVELSREQEEGEAMSGKQPRKTKGLEHQRGWGHVQAQWTRGCEWPAER